MKLCASDPSQTSQTSQICASDPSQLGRWISRDPIGEEGGLNLYGMVSNNPISIWDTLGLIGDQMISGGGSPAGTVSACGMECCGDNTYTPSPTQDCCGGNELYNPDTHCCCNNEKVSRKPIPTGIKICVARGTTYSSIQHKWIEWSGGSTGFYGADNVGGIGTGHVSTPDSASNNPQKKCTDIKLSPCDYDFSKLISALNQVATNLNNEAHPYCPGIYDCTTYVQDLMEGILYPSSTAGLGCTSGGEK